MHDDDLRRRLEGIDPLRDGPDIEPITSPRARRLLEDIMNTPLHTRSLDSGPEATAAPPAGPQRRPRQLALLGAAAALIATVAVGAALLNRDGDAPVAEPSVLELSAGEADPALMSCLPVTAELVAQSPVAFRAIVDSVEGDTVTMTVDQWYRGGDADVVTLTAPLGMEALIGGIAFTPGEAVLITAVDGVVNYCGFSGPATPELQAIFTTAFGG